jgi:ribosomal protein L35AE/L33A
MSFDKPVTCPVNTAYIASRLDLDVHTKQCRLAFHGNILDIPCSSTLQQQHQQQLELAKKKKKKENGDGQRETYLRQLRVFKTKSKRGKLERVEKGNPNMCIASGFFKKDSDISKFIGLSVHLVHQEDSDKTSPPVVGKLVGTFGKSGKVKVEFDKSIEHIEQNADLELRFKKYLFR